MATAFQGSLLDTADEIALRRCTLACTRTQLVARRLGRLPPGVAGRRRPLFDALHHDVPWQAERREMYERVVDVPRLLKFYEEGSRSPTRPRRGASALPAGMP